MKAIILASGYGERMGDITRYVPKPLIPIVNKPILQHLIESLSKCGINDFIFSVGHLKNQIISFLDEFQKKELKFTIKFAKDFNKGPIYSFSACLSEIKDEDFILLPADFLIDPNSLLNLIQKSGDGSLTIAFDDIEANAHHSEVSLALNEEGPKVMGITSKIREEPAINKLLVPLLISRTDFQSYVKRSIGLHHTRVVDAMQLYLEEGNQIDAYEIQNGYWFDLDMKQDVLSTNKFFLEQELYDNQMPNNSDYLNSQNISLQEPVLIGKDCEFSENCVIGPYVCIGDNCSIGQNVKLQNSIIFPGSVIPAHSEIHDAIFFKSIYPIES
jgi:NDP-sugar pyrophosphorylase family protein